MGVHTDALLCWGIKIDEDLLDEDAVGSYGIMECELVREQGLNVVGMGSHLSGNFTYFLVGSKIESSSRADRIDPLGKPSDETFNEMKSCLKKLYGGELKDEPLLEMFLGTVTY